MGGLTFVLSGDFHQILPVIRGGTRADFVRACLKQSMIWPHVQKLSLRTNMRAMLSSNPRAADFASLLLDVGNGSVQSEGNSIELNEGFGVRVMTLDDLINNVYPDIENLPTKRSQWLRERAITSSKNSVVDEINRELLNRYQSESRPFNSIDNVVNSGDITRYSHIYLNSLNPSELLPHKLIIKIGAPIMLLRNLKPPKLCNGTSLQVMGFRNNVIVTKILTGPGTGEEIGIPLDITYSSDMPCPFGRIQYPVKVCFAITIDKAQGQSFNCVGVDLRDNCFSHGQLYVALSRVGKRDAQFILVPGNRTSNIVYPEVLP